MNKNHYDLIEEELRKKNSQEQKKKMKVSGKKVFELQRIIKDKLQIPKSKFQTNPNEQNSK